jgi:chemotaxis methyl-accepting protein methylase
MSQIEVVAYGIDVAVPYIGSYTPDTCIPERTALFRQSSHLPVALSHVANRVTGEGDVSVLSAGCSTGAEADSVMALYGKMRFGGHLAVTGLDKNPIAVARARRGLHWIPEAEEGIELEELKASLEAFGFGFTDDAALDSEGVHDYIGVREFTARYHRVDANPVRKENTVSFMQRDLAKELHVDRSDLILANNILYYHQAESASQIICNLASLLKENGVLSIGENTAGNPERVYMGRYFGHRDVTFHDWISRTARLLKTEFQLEPIETDSFNLPTMFARV